MTASITSVAIAESDFANNLTGSCNLTGSNCGLLILAMTSTTGTPTYPATAFWDTAGGNVAMTAGTIRADAGVFHAPTKNFRWFWLKNAAAGNLAWRVNYNTAADGSGSADANTRPKAIVIGLQDVDTATGFQNEMVNSADGGDANDDAPSFSITCASGNLAIAAMCAAGSGGGGATAATPDSNTTEDLDQLFSTSPAFLALAGYRAGVGGATVVGWTDFASTNGDDWWGCGIEVISASSGQPMGRRFGGIRHGCPGGAPGVNVFRSARRTIRHGFDYLRNRHIFLPSHRIEAAA